MRNAMLMVGLIGSAFLCSACDGAVSAAQQAGAVGPAKDAPAEAPDARAGTAPAPMVHAGGPVVIDGRLDEPCWKRATPVPCDFIMGRTGEAGTDPLGVGYYAWDEHYLYIAYETFDRNLVALPSGEAQGVGNNIRQGASIHDARVPVDIVEFFFAFEDPHYFWEIHHNAANQFNDVWCTIVPDDRPFRKSIEVPHGIRFAHREILEDDGADTVAMASALKATPDGAPSTLNQPGDTDAGYTAEIRIPWRALSAPKAWGHWVDTGEPNPRRPGKNLKRWDWIPAGRTMSILMAIQDGDRKHRYHHSSPTLPGGWFHHGVTYYPVYKLQK